ncbi:DUF6111 family protein [Tistrella bauzanensis]|uniref:DUF6111 family protein n=1 Tax=Tistrella TaxID=171436 RepID=UPI0031F6BF94
MRILLTYVLPFLAPFLLYGGWVLWADRVRERRGVAPAPPPPWVTALAVLALGGSLFVFGQAIGPRPDPGIYVPPHMEDGRIVPGHYGAR